MPDTVLKTPEYSGLGVYTEDPNCDTCVPVDHGLTGSNPHLLQAAKDLNVKYLHGNMSFASHVPAHYNANLVHEHVDVTNGSVGEVRSSLLHYTYGSLDQYFEKFDRYSRWWAEQNFAKGRRSGAGAVFFKPPARFVGMYVLKGGFRDGARGLVLACLAAASVMAKYARLWERSIRK